MAEITNRSVRIFLSSTFRDFAAERNLLQSKVFPEIKHAMAKKGIDVTDVDLRWGVNESESQGGMALRICLDEIDKARPWKDGEMPKDPVARKTAEVLSHRVFFVGMLGERYGWVPAEADNAYQDLLDDHDWLKPYQHKKSVTELEILHGVLENPDMAGHARFYFRDPNYAAAQKEDFFRETEPDPIKRIKLIKQLNELKDKIRESKFEVCENYRDPEAFAEQFKKDILEALEAEFKDVTPPTKTEQEDMDHESYARPRRTLYLGGDDYRKWLDAAVAKGHRRLLIEGQSGGGKSALIANWLHDYRTNNPNDWVFEHYCGLGDDAADPVKLVMRLCQFIKAKTNFPDELKSDPQEILVSLRQWLFNAQFVAEKQNCRLVIALDAVNSLRGEFTDLRWWPGEINDQLKAVTVVASCLPGAVMDAIKPKDAWQSLTVVPLDITISRELFIQYLDQYRKNPDKDLLALIFDGDHAAGRAGMLCNPLFVRTLAEELRVLAPPPDLQEIPDSPGTHIKLWLRSHIEHYLTCQTVPDLFEMVLARIEAYLGDGGVARMQSALASIWVSRAGLSESEVRGIVGRQLELENNDLPQNHWSVIRYNLGEGLMAVTDGRLKFSHDYLKSAVQSRYLDGGDKRVLHDQRVTVAEWFEAQPVTARTADEIPFQWQEAEEWERLRQSLTHQPIIAELLKIKSGDYCLLLLSYWLEVETHLEVNIEEQYQSAWDHWYGKDGKPEHGFNLELSRFLQNAGRYGEFTLFLARKLVNAIEDEFGPNHPDTATSLKNLGQLLYYNGDYDGAEPMLRRALAINEAKLGPDHPNTAASLNNLAQLLKTKGNYDVAEPLFRRALSISEVQFGPDHPETAISLNNLAGLLGAKRDYMGAEQLLRRALAIKENQFGPFHPSTATSLNNLAGLLKTKGNYDDAEPLYRRALAIYEAKLGFEHPDTALSLNNLAGLLYAKGDYDGAEMLFRRVLSIRESKLDSDHPDISVSLNNLAFLLEAKGDYVNAETLYRRTLAIREAKLDPDHPDIFDILNNLATLLAAKGDYDAAEPLYRRVLAITEAKLGPDHPRTATSLSDLALLLKAKGDYDSAELLYRRALAIAEAKLGPDHPDTAASLNNLALLLHAKGDYVNAEPLYRRILAIYEAKLGTDHPNTNYSLWFLANFLREKGDYDGAEPLYRRLLEIDEAKCGPDHTSTAGSLDSLALLLQDKGDYTASEPLYRRALAIRKAKFAPDHQFIADSLFNLAALLHKTGRSGEALPMLEWALEIYQKTYGNEHPTTQNCRNWRDAVRDTLAIGW
ncbi:MAG: tetratricopeptide repeat protein [Candidatus Pacebacteria bacterium]|nr:tetratricopeptide repeat protein [Candidatus Paceibacterota bacterium]